MAITVQQSLIEEVNKIDLAKQVENQHKKAFRVAFDYLITHWPVRNTEEWWEAACMDISIAAADNEDNRLCKELLTAVLDYISSHEAIEISEQVR